MKVKVANNKKITDDDNDVTSSSSSSPPSSSLKLQTTYRGSQVEELANDLTDLGFDGAMGLILKYGHDRVKLAKDRALSRPQGTIKNIPGYIRYLVTTKGAIPEPNGKPEDKYIKGKYGQCVKR